MTAGLLRSPVAGRTDRLPLVVPIDSFVIPADVVSGLGQGNTEAGASILDSILGPSGSGGVNTKIVAAGGEYIASPQQLKRIGGGDIKVGHSHMHKLVANVRSHTRQRLAKLPGPKK